MAGFSDLMGGLAASSGGGADLADEFAGQTPASQAIPKAQPVVPSNKNAGEVGVKTSSPLAAVTSLQESGQNAGDILDQLNDSLFGQKGVFGGITHGTDFSNPITDAVGNVAGAVGGAVATSLRLVPAAFTNTPIGWLPNGVDQHFRDYRSLAQQQGAWTDADEKEWQLVDAAAGKDFLGGANLKYNFLAEKQKQAGEGGLFKGVALGLPGSLGGVLAEVMTDGLGAAQRLTERTVAGMNGRVDDILKMKPADMNDVEKQVYDRLQSGQWDRSQALDFLAAEHAGLSHDALVQAVGSIASDPTVWASLGAAGAARLAATGARAAESALVGKVAMSGLERAGVTAYELQRSLGPAAKVVRTIIDPLSAIGGDTAITQAAVDLLSKQTPWAVALGAYGAGATSKVFQLADRLGITENVQSAFNTYSTNVARAFAVTEHRAYLMKTIPEAMLNVVPDEVISDVLKTTKNGFKRLEDHAYRVRKYTFSVDDDTQLANRLGELFKNEAGMTPDQWGAEIARMSDEEKGMWHAISYSGTEESYIPMLAKVATEAADTAEAGSIASKLKRLVLLNDNTMDDVSAKNVIDSVTPEKVAARMTRRATKTPVANATDRLSKLRAQLDEITTAGRPERPLDSFVYGKEGQYTIHGPVEYDAAVAKLQTKIANAEQAVTKAQAEADAKLAATGKSVEVLQKEAAAAATESAAGLDIQQRADLLNAAIRKYSNIRDLGTVDSTEASVENAIKELQHRIDANIFHSRLTEEQLATLPETFRNWVAEHPTWNIGWSPNEEYLWGLARDAEDRLFISRDPFVSHVIAGAAPHFRPVADVARNALGQVIPEGMARIISKPLDAAEVYARTGAHQITSYRLVKNFEQRLAQRLVGAGLTEHESDIIWRKVADEAIHLKKPVQSLTPQEVWKVAEKAIPPRVNLTQRDLFAHIMHATEGDLRIVGMTSKLSSRIRSAAVDAGLSGNLLGQITGDFYMKARYTYNPTFAIQRMTDMPFFRILRGVRKIDAAKQAEVQTMLDNMIDTGIFKDFAHDMLEFRQHGDMVDRLKTIAQERNLTGVLDKISRLENDTIRSNQLSYIYGQLGDLVKQALSDTGKQYDELVAARDAAKVAHEAAPSMESAVALQNAEERVRDLSPLEKNFAQLREHYSLDAGKLLNDNEVAFQYLKEMFRDAKKSTPENFLNHITEAEWKRPASIGALEPLEMDYLAKTLGEETDHTFRTWADMRKALTAKEGEGRISKDWLRQQLINRKAHPDYINRVVNAVDFHPDQFWRDVAERFPEATKGEINRVRNLFASMATARGFQPADYLSQVVSFNAKNDLGGEIGKALDIIKTGMVGNEEERMTKLGDLFASLLDPSQREDMITKMAEGGADAMIKQAISAGNRETANQIRQVREGLRGHILPPEAQTGGRVVTMDEMNALQAQGHDLVDALRAQKAEPLGWWGNKGEMKADTEIAAAYATVVKSGKQYRVNMNPRSGNGRVVPETRPNVETAGLGRVEDAKTEPGYLYHTTDRQSAMDISQSGLEPATPDFRQEQDAWPWSARGDEPAGARSYWNRDASMVVKYQPEPGSVLLRAKEEGFNVRSEPHGGDQYLTDQVPSANLEVLGGDGQWHPLPGYFDTTPRTMHLTPIKTATYSVAKVSDEATFGKLYRRFVNNNMTDLRRPGFSVSVQREGDKVVFSLNVHSYDPKEAEAVNAAFGQARPSVALGGVLDIKAPVLNRKEWTKITSRDFIQRVLNYENEADPDIKRAVQYFSQFAREFMRDDIKRDPTQIGSALGKVIRDIPTDSAVPYNYTQAVAINMMKQQMRDVALDSARVADMSSSRSVLDRTLNHPLFGLYPASYMWGKLLPEFVRFIAKAPFGLRTGALAYAMDDLQASLAAQYEYDPEFQKFIEGIGSSPALFMFAYWAPGLPSDALVARPSPVVSTFAQQGMNVPAMIQNELKMIDPNRWYKTTLEGATQLEQAGQNIVAAGRKAVTGTPTPKQATPAQALQPVLTDNYDQLYEMLSEVLTGK